MDCGLWKGCDVFARLYMSVPMLCTQNLAAGSYVPQDVQHDHATADMSSCTAHVGICSLSEHIIRATKTRQFNQGHTGSRPCWHCKQAVVTYLVMRPSSVATATATAYAMWGDSFTTSCRSTVLGCPALQWERCHTVTTACHTIQTIHELRSKATIKATQDRMSSRDLTMQKQVLQICSAHKG